MLSKIVPALIFAVAFAQAGIAVEEDYASRLKELRDRKADAQIEPLLNEWRENRPNDPEAWITSANYYFNKRQMMISIKKPEKGDFTVTDKKTGKVAGSISFESDEGAAKRAAELLEEATKKFPDRLDIWCGLAFTFQEMGNFDSELSILQKMVAYAREHPERLRWLKGEELLPIALFPKNFTATGCITRRRKIRRTTSASSKSRHSPRNNFRIIPTRSTTSRSIIRSAATT